MLFFILDSTYVWKLQSNKIKRKYSVPIHSFSFISFFNFKAKERKIELMFHHQLSPIEKYVHTYQATENKNGM